MFFFAKNHFPTQNLLSDAEVGEDVLEDFVWGDGASCDFGEVGEGEAEVFSEEVARERFVCCCPLAVDLSCSHAFDDASEAFVGFHEGVVVAGVGYDDVVLGYVRDVC